MYLLESSDKMRIRNIKNAQALVKENSYVINNPEQYKGHFQELFQNNNPIHLEIGMGKGDFIIKMAQNYPNINFIGLERYDSIIARALKKLDHQNIPNLKIIALDALKLSDVFSNEISLIYLNFSDPWPKTRHAKRRLTSATFLPIYDQIFRDKCVIVQKTDNQGLFESSLISLSEYGYILKEISLDLANTDIPNVETEYERKFKNLGFKINYLRVEKNNKK